MANGVLELASVYNSTTFGFTINGIAVDEQAGCTVAPAGDVNGDGTADIIISAPYAPQ